jgi:hypothetical protein
MAKLITGFHLFGTGNVYLRSLVIYRCALKQRHDEKKLVTIQRTREQADGSYTYEDSNVDYTVFSRGGTFHLHDLYLSESFGITVKFIDGQGQFELSDNSSNSEQQQLLVFFDPERDEVSLLCHAEVSPIK